MLNENGGVGYVAGDRWVPEEPDEPSGPDLDKVLADIDAAREHYEAFQRAWSDVGRAVREINEWLWHRVDAYPSWTGNRDVGGGVHMLGWMDEVEQAVDGERDG